MRIKDKTCSEWEVIFGNTFRPLPLHMYYCCVIIIQCKLQIECSLICKVLSIISGTLFTNFYKFFALYFGDLNKMPSFRETSYIGVDEPAAAVLRRTDERTRLLHGGLGHGDDDGPRQTGRRTKYKHLKSRDIFTLSEN
jgi:hypothetical protein